MFNVSDGSLLASVDLPSYLSSSLADDDLLCTSSSLSSSSFCLLQVSADLSTAVAITQCHTAIAVNLDHYFRYSMSKTSELHVSSTDTEDRGETSECFCLPGHIRTTYCVLMPPLAPVSCPNTPETRTACRVPTAASSP